MNQPDPAIRFDDLLRHLKDLHTGTYEEVQERTAKEEIYRQGIQLLTPVALAVLQEANSMFLENTRDIQIVGPQRDDSGGWSHGLS